MSSFIQDFFQGKNVLITGATGFVGDVLQKTLVEKVPKIGKITCLYHSKPPPVVDLSNIEFHQCDLTRTDLGMTYELKKRIQEETHVVFHLAAYTKWDKGEREQVCLNTIPGLNVAEWLKGFDKLESAFFASSYWASLRNRKRADVYPEAIVQDNNARKELMDIMNGSSPTTYSNEWPNTYSYSKNLLERLLDESYSHLPLTLGRIASVNAAWEFPKRGYCFFDNAQPAMLKAFMKHGVTHFPKSIKTALNDCIPVDICVNLMLANVVSNAGKRLNVINLASGTINPTMASDMFDIVGGVTYHGTMEEVIAHLKSEPQSRQAKLNQTLLMAYQIGMEEKHLFSQENARRPLQWMTAEDEDLFPCRIETVEWPLIFHAMINELNDSKPNGKSPDEVVGFTKMSRL